MAGVQCLVKSVRREDGSEAAYGLMPITSLKEELELLRSKGEAERIRLQQLDPIINTMMDERALVEYLLERGQEQNKKRS
ncbi:unnamed protein product [Rhizopus microsporus]